MIMVKPQPNGLVALDRKRVSALLWQIERGDNCPENEKTMLMEECCRRSDAICCQFGTLPPRKLPSVEEIRSIVSSKYNCNCKDCYRRQEDIAQAILSMLEERK